jgi:hypothetical protein
LIRTIKWLLLLRALARVSPTALLALAMVTSAAASSILPQGWGHGKTWSTAHIGTQVWVDVISVVAITHKGL